MKHTMLRQLGAAMFAVTALTACGDDDQGPGRGIVVVQLTDAPFPFDSVARADIHVLRVDARIADINEQQASQDADGSENGEDPSRGWITIATPDRTIDLLALQRGVVTNLGVDTIPTGRYRGFRLILDTDRSSITLKSGQVLDGDSDPGVQWPSAGQTGIKVNLVTPFVVTRDSTVLVLDFDLGKSFVLRGNSISQNGLLFKPVIRATARDLTGAVSGTVRAGSATGALVAGATVEVLRQGTTLGDTVTANIIATTSTDAQGAWRAAFLMPGTYTLRAFPPSGLAGYLPVTIPTVTITTGQDATGTTIVLPPVAQ